MIRHTIAGAIVALATLTASTTAAQAAVGHPTGRTAVESCQAPVVAAHRGGDFYTESTARNFAASVAHGATVMETDVQFTATQRPVLLHDTTLDVFGSSKPISSVSITQAASLRSSDGSRIETLYQFGRQMQSFPQNVTALVELKTAPNLYEWTLIEDELGALGHRVWVGSFFPQVTTAARLRGFQSVQIDGSNTSDAARPPGAVASLGSAYERDLGKLTSAGVAAMRGRGVAVYAWTVDTPAAWALTLAVGALPLTDDPAGFLSWYRSADC